MDQNRIKFLFESFMNKTIKPEEQEELLQLIENHKEEDFLTVVSEIIDSSDKENISFENWTNLLSNSIAADKPVAKIRRFKSFYKYASAAAILLLIGIATYFYIDHTNEEEEIAVVSEIKPGENKAVLIMANGNSIELDENIKEEDVHTLNPNIKAISDGELVYNEAEEAQSKSVGINILRIPRGGQYRVVLADGTIVWLNADSELKFPSVFEKEERVVELKGEAYFEVTSYANKKWPFKVKSLGQEIEVLGTKFNVSAYQEDKFINTTLIEGKVKVLYENSQKSILLKPGQEASLNKNSSNMRVFATDVEEAIAWKEGLFVFNSQDLYIAMNKISRWYDVEVVYKGDFKDKALWGTISRNEKLESLLKTLQATKVAKFKIEGRRILVMP